MTKTNRKMPQISRIRRRACCAGFTLLELLVAMAVFAVVSGAALMVFRSSVPLLTAQQNQTSLNISMRNAAAQMQIDSVNAGLGFLQSINIASLPVGITIVPGTGACFNASGNTYSSGCFDKMNIIVLDQSTPPANPTDNGANCVSTTSSNVFATPTGSTTLAQLAADYHTGDQILLVSSDGSHMNMVTLTADGSVSGGKVQLSHNPQGDAANSWGISSLPNNKLGTQFCNTDWVLRLSGRSTTYSVDATDPTNPKLIRTQGGKTAVVADQVIGFRVGAMAQRYNPGQPDDGQMQYFYDPAMYNSDWTTIRAVRISLIGRTPPAGGSFAGFRNSFDNGSYRVEGVSVVINPRNLSWN